MFSLKHVLLSHLLSLSILTQVLADAVAEPDPAFDKWNFDKKMDFSGDNFEKSRFLHREDQEEDNLRLTGNFITMADVEAEESVKNPYDEEKDLLVHKEDPHHNYLPSFNQLKKIDSENFKGFIKTMFSSTTTTTTSSVFTTSTISFSRFDSSGFGHSRFGSYPRFGSSSALKSSDIQTTEPTTTSTPPDETSSSQISDVPATVVSEALVSSTTDSAFLTTTSTTSIPTSEIIETVTSEVLMSSTTDSSFPVTTSSSTAVSNLSVSPSTSTSQVSISGSTVTTRTTVMSTVTSLASTHFSSGTTSISTLMSLDEILVSSTTEPVFHVKRSLSSVVFNTSESTATSTTVKTSSPFSSASSMHASSRATSLSTSSTHTSRSTTSIPISDVGSTNASLPLVSLTTASVVPVTSTSYTPSSGTTSHPTVASERKGSDKNLRSGLLSRGFFPPNDANIVEDDIASLPSGFVPKSRVSSTESASPVTSTSPATGSIATSFPVLVSSTSDVSVPSSSSTAVFSPSPSQVTMSALTLALWKSSSTPIASVSSTQTSSSSGNPLETLNMTTVSGVFEFSTFAPTTAEGITTRLAIPTTQLPSTRPRETPETSSASKSPSTTMVTSLSSTVSTSSLTMVLLGERSPRVYTTSTMPSTAITTLAPETTVAYLETETVGTSVEDAIVEFVSSNDLEIATFVAQPVTLHSSTATVSVASFSENITHEEFGTDGDAEVDQPVTQFDYDNDVTTIEPVHLVTSTTPPSSRLQEDLVDEASEISVIGNIIEDDISAFLPTGFVTSNLESEESNTFEKDENIVEDDVSAFLPPGFVGNDEENYIESTTAERKGSYENSRSGLLSNGFSPPNDENIVEDDIASLPSGFAPKSRVSSLKNRYKSLRKKTSKSIDNVKKDVEEKPETGLSRFGRVTTTTVDPISEILANVVILDVANYLPKGYDFSQVETEEEEVNEDVENINDLLIKKEEENNRKFKPGKLNGKKLAAISKELKEADRYYSSVGEEKLVGNNEKVLDVQDKPKSRSEPKKKISLKSKDQNNENERNGKKISDATFEFSAESIFASILGGEEIKIDNVGKEMRDDEKPESRPKKTYGWREPKEDLESFASVSPSTSFIPPRTTTTPIPTTSTPRPTTPGVCGDFCNLAGTIFIKSGLEWSEELSYPSTEEYKDATKNIVREMTTVFDQVYFGSAFEFASVEAFSTRDEMVLVDIYVQFSDIVFNITTKDVKESFEELLTVNGSKQMMGMFEIDMVWTYFMVVDTTIPLASMTTELQGVYLPDWALLVAVVGVISTFIVAFLGVVMGFNKYRHNQVLKTRVLNPKTLQQFRGQRHFDKVEVDHVTAYAQDKRDMWTLQKVNQEKRRSKTSLGKKFGYADSGRGSSSTRGSEKYLPTPFGKPFGNSGKGTFYERFPSLGKGSSSGNNPNDSNAELLEGFDNSGFNSSGEILDRDVADRDTSYENEDDDYEDEVRLSARGNAEYRRSDNVNAEQRNISRANLLHSLGEQGMTFGDSDSSLDAVSDGPSERL